MEPLHPCPVLQRPTTMDMLAEDRLHLSSCGSGGRSPTRAPLGYDQAGSGTAFPLGAPGQNPSWPFPASRGAHTVGLSPDPAPIIASHHRPPPHKDACDDLGPTPVIQSPHLTSVPQEVPQLQVWASGRGPGGTAARQDPVSRGPGTLQCCRSAGGTRFSAVGRSSRDPWEASAGCCLPALGGSWGSPAEARMGGRGAARWSPRGRGLAASMAWPAGLRQGPGWRVLSSSIQQPGQIDRWTPASPKVQPSPSGAGGQL